MAKRTYSKYSLSIHYTAYSKLFNVEPCVVMHIGTNNKLYSYDMNNATLKTVDVERDLIIMKIFGTMFNGSKKSELCFRYD